MEIPDSKDETELRIITIVQPLPNRNTDRNFEGLIEDS